MNGRYISALLLLALTSVSQAELVGQSGLSVTRLLSDSSKFGGCMAKLENYNNPPGCGRGWVTFDCEGIHDSKEAGRRALEVAQMAFALEKEIYVAVETTELINGYCNAKRVDVIR